MKATLIGYNYVKYSKDGQYRSFVSVYVSTPKEITYGVECLNVTCSTKYFNETILPASRSSAELCLGFDSKKGNKPFLYVKK